MLTNRLKLNHDEAQFIVLDGKKAIVPPYLKLLIGNLFVPDSDYVSNLGFIFDTHQL